MLDWKWAREHPEVVEEALRKRGMDPELFRELIGIDERRRSLQQEVDALRAERNRLSKQIGQYKREGHDPSQLLAEVQEISEKVKELETLLKEIEEEWKAKLLLLPNLPHESVPVGRDEADNQEVKRWGEIPALTFQPRPHWEIGEGLGIIDFERAAKIASSRFAVLW